MQISIIICTHQTHRYLDFVEAINSLLTQSYENTEIIVVVDGNEELYEKISGNENKNVDKIIFNDKNLGLSESRNKGIKEANGDVIAFFDDDAVADENWLKELAKMYEEKEAIAAGGKLLPKWVTKKPKFLPEEYYWLVGATHKGFPEKVTEVRNTFGSNLSFKADVLRELGGFRSEMGVKGKGLLQGEETELCERMRNKFGKGVIYNPAAIVYHKVFPERLKVRFLLKRAFWQGYSKRMMEELGYSIDEESDFVRNLLFNSIPERLKPSSTDLLQLVFLGVLTLATVWGYIFRRFVSWHSAPR
ncbi:MAG: glycosyltransferase family 2 protein [Methanophagales archaeon]|nr:glycosyltransferase family 2 protein [Methanophagales archaeon]